MVGNMSPLNVTFRTEAAAPYTTSTTPSTTARRQYHRSPENKANQTSNNPDAMIVVNIMLTFRFAASQSPNGPNRITARVHNAKTMIDNGSQNRRNDRFLGGAT